MHSPINIGLVIATGLYSCVYYDIRTVVAGCIGMYLRAKHIVCIINQYCN